MEILTTIIDYIKNHFLSYSEMPNIRTVEIECKINLEPFENEPPGYWADRLRARYHASVLTNMLKDFQNGKSLTFNNATVWDDGVSIIKPGGWFGSDEKEKFSWSEIQIYSSNGHFVIEATNNTKFVSEIGYQDVYNIHFLEQLIRMKFKDSNARKLSDLLNN